MKQSRQDIREAAEADLYTFAHLINPTYQYGEVHERVFRWMQDDEDSRRKLLLLPRGHLKSHCVAVWCAWEITRNPWTSIVYVSAGEDLAKDQVYAIKNMMVSDIYRAFWPEMINEREGDREHWSAFSFNVDHPERKKRRIRDHTMIVRTVKSNAIGLHGDHIVFDDVIVPAFAYSETGRREASRSLAQYTSILNPGGSIKCVGTRYHTQDAYDGMIKETYRIWDPELKEFSREAKLWDIMEEKTEDIGDGTGEFLWPRVVSPVDGRGYGFDIQNLEMIKADYRSRGQMTQFWAQYYNDPNNADDQRVSKDMFQYFDRKHLTVTSGKVYYKAKRLNVFAAMDIATTDSEKSDYTAIAVVGVDSDGYIYVIDLDQFKTTVFQEYYDRVLALQLQWGFRKIRIETNSGGSYVKQELENLVRRNGGSLTIDGKATTSHDGKKAERHAAILEPRYCSQTILHFKGGHTSVLEEQIMLERPPNDDLEDALCAAVEISKPPGQQLGSVLTNRSNVVYNTRFGGRTGR